MRAFYTTIGLSPHALDRSRIAAGRSVYSCGVDICPTGALFARSEKWMRPEAAVSTICPYCGVGCRLELGVRDGRIVSIHPDREGPVNRGQACIKGRFDLDEIVHHPDRITTPLIRRRTASSRSLSGRRPALG